MAFMAKLPVYRFHSWLPKAHVDAPVRRSIVLARILLKLRWYGVLRTIQAYDINLSFLLVFRIWTKKSNHFLFMNTNMKKLQLLLSH